MLKLESPWEDVKSDR